ncbi:MAG: Hsp20/alpha crystallin family protein [Candidatus Bathyarchaeota archaeon]|nr:MAG: Hsp20/alpha crystallin family protein [Candidatus Bathyarchaeota archaeon]
MLFDIDDEDLQELWDLKRRSLVPLSTLTETNDAIVVELDLPRVRKQDIHIKLVEDTLEIQAALHTHIRFERWGTVQQSCEFRLFHKVISLPQPVRMDQTHATFKKGILRIDLQKRTETEHRISITEE